MRMSKLKQSTALPSLLLGFAIALAPAAVLLQSVPAAAQQGLNQRIVEGHVENKDGKHLSGVVVYLKDTGSLTIKSFVTGEDGAFRFVQLSPQIDYELWAGLNGKRSKTMSISSFSDRKDFIFTLVLPD
jgi:hypothetical protein